MAILQAPAKINLTLEVLRRRDDGYHNLRSVMVPLALHDEITIQPGSHRLQLRSNCAAIDATDNLVVAALQALELPAYDFEVFLNKRIPVAGGLGGGSSDAAAILIGAMSGLFGEIGPKDYIEIARDLGSDVPFFLAQAPALVEGTGERVTPLGAVPPWQCTIVQPPVAVSTSEAYALLDARKRVSRSRKSSTSVELGEALQRCDFSRVCALAENDFEDVLAGAHPQIRTALMTLAAWNGFARLTGSGSCVYTLSQQLPVERLPLPPGFKRFDTTFQSTSAWRSETPAMQSSAQ